MLSPEDSAPAVGNGLTHRDADATATKGMLIAILKTSLTLRVVFLACLQKQGVSQQASQWSLSIIAGAASNGYGYGTEPARISPSAIKVWWRSKAEDQSVATSLQSMEKETFFSIFH